MFSSLFGKRRSSPVEEETAPIPGPKPDDGFVVVDPLSPRTGLYPNIPGGSNPVSPYPLRPAPPAPQRPAVDQTFHYLQGVPFTLCRELQMSSNKNAIVAEVSDLLAFLTSKLNMSGYEYDFSLERSVLKEC